WSVPGDLFNVTSHTAYLSGDNNNWATLDLDGDDKPDLVLTSDPSNGLVNGHGTGTPYWAFFKNTGSAFSAVVQRWPVPGDLFNATGHTAYLSGDNNNWATIDLDGDGKLDLVLTSDPSNGLVNGHGTGTPYWVFYKNTGSGFSTGVQHWPVPGDLFNAT